MIQPHLSAELRLGVKPFGHKVSALNHCSADPQTKTKTKTRVHFKFSLLGDCGSGLKSETARVLPEIHSVGWK